MFYIPYSLVTLDWGKKPKSNGKVSNLGQNQA